LVRVGINACLALRRGIALSLFRPANPDEVLSKNPLVEGVHIDGSVALKEAARAL
jgi:hypothetical protein